MATRDGARRAPPPIPLTLLLLAGLLAGSATGGTAATRTGAKRPPGMSAVEADTLLRSYAKDRAETPRPRSAAIQARKSACASPVTEASPAEPP